MSDHQQSNELSDNRLRSDDELYAYVVETLRSIGQDFEAADQKLTVAMLKPRDGEFEEARLIDETMGGMVRSARQPLAALALQTDWRNAMQAVKEADAEEWFYDRLLSGTC